MFNAAITKARTARARASRSLRTRRELSLMITQASARLSASLRIVVPSCRSANTRVANRKANSGRSHDPVRASGSRIWRTARTETREEYRQAEPDGYGYSRWCELYRAWEGRLSPTMRQSHPAGERMFVDYAGQTIELYDGRTGEIGKPRSLSR